MFFIQPVHQNRIDDENQHKADDGSLLSHPESKRRAAHCWEMRVQPLPEEDTAAKADSEPGGEQPEDYFKAGTPMSAGMIHFHNNWDSSLSNGFYN